MKRIKIKSLITAACILLIIAFLAWLLSNIPDIIKPAKWSLNDGAAIISCGILVFREGLEAILVLSAITATVSRKQSDYASGVASGVGLGLLSTLATWFIVVAVLSDINLPELDIQAATGILAILVLLVVMNWFFHKFYWTGWISNHTNRGRKVVEYRNNDTFKMFRGFMLLGFTAIYREGFEVVLFLQQLRLKDGGNVVLAGAIVGVILTSIVAVLTFVLHRHLPYKKMLVLTGVLLGIVLLVMVGESVQEMQQAGWLPTTPIGISIPDWIGVWFAVFPNLQGFIAQGTAALLVLGSYGSAQYIHLLKLSRIKK